ncbi:hypothetical protein GGS26DRAFT_205327 [Hypomontagnella submonticulosa]|nr:hypothetical protein GGS26DRAFT_205327 [Hypomontagnella submonticulosa]
MLLSLPQELRDQIFTLVCIAARKLPDPSTCRIEHRRTCEGYGFSRAPTARDRVWFERRAIENPMLSLLLVNHQVHRETQDVLRRISDPPNYAIDIMFLNDGTLWPTWLSVPKLQRNLGNVYAQFRVFHTPGHLQARNADDLYGSEDPGPPPIVWLFYHLLSGFLRNGPLALDRDKDDGGFTVQNLILDFLPASEKGILPFASFIQYFKEVDDVAAPNPLEIDPGRGGDESLLAAEYLAHFIRALLLRLLNLKPSAMKYGRILYENVGDIEIRINGQFKWRLGIPEMLSKLSFGNGVNNSRMVTPEQRFWHWKQVALARRRKASLPIEYASH